MTKIVEYRVISESEGHITERNDERDARERAQEFNNDPHLPNDHYVEEHIERF